MKYGWLNAQEHFCTGCEFSLMPVKPTSAEQIDFAAEPEAIRHVTLAPGHRAIAAEALRVLDHASLGSWPFERPGFIIRTREGGFHVRLTDVMGREHAFLADYFTLRPWLAWLSGTLI
jgi:hypothetical protein